VSAFKPGWVRWYSKRRGLWSKWHFQRSDEWVHPSVGGYWRGEGCKIEAACGVSIGVVQSQERLERAPVVDSCQKCLAIIGAEEGGAE
jgi:hypothetical protein